MSEPNKKQPKGAPELPDDSKKLLDDQGDISTQKSTEPENLPEVIEPGIAGDENETGTEETDETPEENNGKKHHLKKFFAGYWRHKKWALPLTVLVIIGVLLAVPATRYPMLAPMFTNTYSVEILDSKNGTPVTGATVKIDEKSVVTDSDGRAKLRAKVGKHTIAIDKKYYESATSDIFVGLKTRHADTQVKLVATGRQVPVTVVDKLSGKPVANAEVRVLDTSAKTDGTGKTIIVLPTKNTTETATIAASGYNKLNAKIHITDAVVPANTFSLVPAGRAFFLSNKSGTVDVVSTNFDGTARETIAAGTGNEDATTRLFVSPDQKHLALYAKRDDSKAAKLYVVDTDSGKLSAMDTAIADFTPYGWSGDHFIYQTTSLTIHDWQSRQSILKYFDATNNRAAVIDETAAKGTETDYIHQNFGFVEIVGGRVVYGLAWARFYASLDVTLSKQHDSIISVNADGTDRRNLKDVTLTAHDGYTFLSAVQPTPDKLYIQLGTDSGEVYYTYQDGNVTQTNAVNAQSFSKQYPTYYTSPNGQYTFWTESRDGQDAMFVGDANAGNAKQVATLDSFVPYGWDTNGYLLVSKGGSQLYILPVGGLTTGKQPMKVSDYYVTQRGFGP
jgi:hypothetical protein